MSIIKRPPTLKMALPGSHVVKKQARISKNGIIYFVKAHIRKNRGKKIVLLQKIFFFSIGTEIENTQFLARLKVMENFPNSVLSFNFGSISGKTKDLNFLKI